MCSALPSGAYLSQNVEHMEVCGGLCFAVSTDRELATLLILLNEGLLLDMLQIAWLRGIMLERVMGLEPTTFSLGS